MQAIKQRRDTDVKYIIVGNNAGQVNMATSSDGIKWTGRIPVIASSGIPQDDLDNVMYANDRWFASNGGGLLIYSLDGLEWFYAQGQYPANILNVKFVNGIFFVVGYDGVCIAKSTDGITFTSVLFDPDIAISDITYRTGDNIYVATNQWGNTASFNGLFWSSNSTFWNEFLNVAENTSLKAIVTEQTKSLAVGIPYFGSNILWDFGSGWFTANSDGTVTNTINAATFFGNKFYIGGSGTATVANDVYELYGWNAVLNSTHFGEVLAFAQRPTRLYIVGTAGSSGHNMYWTDDDITFNFVTNTVLTTISDMAIKI